MFNPRAKLLYHGDRVKEWIDTGKTRPILMEISPTGFCNASCPWCLFKDKVESKIIETVKLKKVLLELRLLGVQAINWTGGGEPTLHPDFAGLVSYADELGLKQGLFTNGYETIPLQDKFEWIRISLTPRGIGAIKPPTSMFGVCVNQIKEYTPEYLENCCLMSRDIGASYLQMRPILMDNYTLQPDLVVPTFLKKYETDDFKVHLTEYKYEDAIKPRGYSVCYGHHFCLSIDWRGQVLPCMYLSNHPDYVFGNIYKDKFTDIWNKIPKSLKVFEGCMNCCKNHEVNKLLIDVKRVKNVEFL